MADTKPREYVHTPVVAAVCGCTVYGDTDCRVVPCVRHRANDIPRIVLEALTRA